MTYNKMTELRPLLHLTKIDGIPAPSEEMVQAINEYALWIQTQSKVDSNVAEKVRNGAWMLWNDMCARLELYAEITNLEGNATLKSIVRQYVSLIGQVNVQDGTHEWEWRNDDSIGQVDQIGRLSYDIPQGQQRYNNIIEYIKIAKTFALQLVDWLTVEEQRAMHEQRIISILQKEFESILQRNADVGHVAKIQENYARYLSWWRDEIGDLRIKIAGITRPHPFEGEAENPTEWLQSFIERLQIEAQQEEAIVRQKAIDYAQRAAEIAQAEAAKVAEKKAAAKARREERKAAKAQQQ